MEFLGRLFDPAGFPARWHCGSGWADTPWLGWLHILSDLGVWGAYLAIPVVLIYFLLRRRDLPFRKIFLLFGAFILACGTTHLVEAIIFWWPVYRLAGVIKLLTAIVSWATVVSLFRVVPSVLTMRTPEELEREIVGRKQAEGELQRANTELEQRVRARTFDLEEADRRKDEFLATLAHELRNPLAPIRNGLQVLRLAGSGGPEVEQSRVMMERQLVQMVRLVDDLLDVSRITRNRLELRTERVELKAVIESALETCRPLIEQAGHKLTVALPAAPIYLNADFVRLSQVFSNLLNNSSKYTERGGHIQITVETQGGEALVRVRDNGVGIPPEAMPRLFEMFSQVDRNMERAQGGLGIGLTLVRRLVELHGGRVEVQSDGPGQGSEFTVRLPALLATPEPASPAAPAANDKPKVPQRRILVVDDNKDSAVTLGMLLKIMGNETSLAHDGLQAVELAESFRPDLILLDIGLPKLNGYDVCRRIREQAWGKRMVVIALTGWGQEADRLRSVEAGFDHHLVKPVDHALLKKLLDELSAPSAEPMR